MSKLTGFSTYSISPNRITANQLKSIYAQEYTMQEPKPMQLTSKSDAPSKFLPAFELTEQLSTELGTEVWLAGGALRDVYFDAEPKDWDIFIPVGHEQGIDITVALINKLYMSVGTDGEVIKPPVKHVPRREYKPQPGMKFKSAGYFLFDNKLVNIIVCDWFKLASFDFDVNQTAIYQGSISYLDKLYNILTTGEFKLIKVPLPYEVDELGRQADYLEQKLNLTLSPGSRKVLGKYNPSSYEQVEGIVAYRVFSVGMNDNEPRLRSPSQGDIWESKHLVADCTDGNIIQHILSQNELCGINMFTDVIETGYDKHMIVAEVTPLGFTTEFELGYRSEEAEIKRMWIIRENIEGQVVNELKLDEVSPNNNERLALADYLQAHYKVPVNVSDRRAIRAIIKSRSGRIKL